VVSLLMNGTPCGGSGRLRPIRGPEGVCSQQTMLSLGIGRERALARLVSVHKWGFFVDDQPRAAVPAGSCGGNLPPWLPGSCSCNLYVYRGARAGSGVRRAQCERRSGRGRG
jgi:hypothetical protein